EARFQVPRRSPGGAVRRRTVRPARGNDREPRAQVLPTDPADRWWQDGWLRRLDRRRRPGDELLRRDRAARGQARAGIRARRQLLPRGLWRLVPEPCLAGLRVHRSEEHTSELQSPYDLVCRLLLEKK